MAEQIFIVENGTLTKFETDDFVEEVYIPDCVKKIGCRSFYESPVGKVVIPDSVTTIESEAFLCCRLTEIEIPDSVTSIGLWAIGYGQDLFHPWFNPIPFRRPVILYGKKGSEAERYAKDNDYCYCEHITEFQEIKIDTENDDVIE